jgi:hypothetical protein
VAFGVGSGSTGISDILRGNFFGGGTSTSSQVNDKKRRSSKAKDISAYLDLAGIYQQDRRGPALATLAGAGDRAEDFDVLNRIAGIYSGRAEIARTNARNAQAQLLQQHGHAARPRPDHRSAARSRTTPTAARCRRNERGLPDDDQGLLEGEERVSALAVASAGTSRESTPAQLASSPARRRRGTAIKAYTRFLQIAGQPERPGRPPDLQQLKASTAQTQTQG